MQNTVAVISLKKIRSNARKIKRQAGVSLIAVVKDNGYGHGAVEVAHALDNIADMFAVSTVDEGAALRVGGITKDVLVLSPPLCEEEVVRACAYRLTLSLTSLAVLRLCARAKTGELLAHISVNTGMNRYGFRPDAVSRCCREALRAGILVTGIYSHLYLAEDERICAEQARLFLSACDCARAYFPHCMRHLSSTGGALRGIAFDGVRAGIALYGYLPQGFEGALPVQPAAKLYATVSHACVPFGGGAGYAKYEGNAKELHTLRLGYGDGFFRAGGVEAQGKLCMDACVREGKARIGARRLVLKSVTEYARAHGTTEYEVLVNILNKAVKIYV